MSETKYPTKTKNIKGKKSKNLTRKYDLNRKKAGKTSPGRERKNTHPEKWISPQKKSKESHQEEGSHQKKKLKSSLGREKKYTHPKKWISQKDLTRKRYLTKKAYKMSPGKEISQKKIKKAHQEESVKDCKAAENVDEAWLQAHFLFLREHQKADDVT